MNLQSVGSSLRLREYYYMFTRHKVIFVITTALALLVSMAVAISMQKIFRADTVLMIEDEKILNPLISGLAISPSVNARMRSMREELLSWQRLTLLVEKLKLGEKVKTPLEFERLIRKLRTDLSIKMKDGYLITVSCEDADPKKAQEIVQALSDIIIEGNLTSTKIEASSAIRFIKQQLEAYKGKLEESEEELRKFREIYSTTLPVATRMNEHLVQLRLELNNLLINNTEEHPRVVQTRKLIEQLEKQRDNYMRQAKAEGADIDPSEYAKLVSSVPRQEQHLSKLQRDYAVNDRIYEQLLQRLETAKISETLENSDKGTKFRILEPARLPLEPVKPNKVMIVIGGFFAGLGLGFVIIYLIELSDTSIRNLDEARSILEFPVFGSISPIEPEEIFIEESLRKEASV